ncbi:MAG: hypothetical protein DA328_05755 [Nitrososphaeraceae archaeon]|nr:hypothetical protein [Nitrososphaeraceae archaeon]
MSEEINNDRDIQENIEESAEEVKENLEETSNKMQAGAKAIGKKILHPERDLVTEYRKEKIKEVFD